MKTNVKLFSYNIIMHTSDKHFLLGRRTSDNPFDVFVFFFSFSSFFSIIIVFFSIIEFSTAYHTYPFDELQGTHKVHNLSQFD